MSPISNQRFASSLLAFKIMGRKDESVTLSLTADDKASLEALAAKHGCMWGKTPNISRLIQQIAIGQLRIVAESDKTLEAQALLKTPTVKSLYELLEEQFRDD